MFLTTGFKLLTAGGDTGKLSEAKQSMINILIGLVLIGAAWLIVDQIFAILEISDKK